jgi:uncharacterized protein (TIGR00730 family)
MITRLKKYIKFLTKLSEINLRIIKGMWKLTKFPQPAITFFGSARTPIESPYSQKAFLLSKELTRNGFSIITGGGPGIMEAANRGAYETLQEQGHQVKKHARKRSSLGIGITRLNKDGENHYVHDFIVMSHFFTRKWLLVRYSTGFIVFPGGFGTLDELFEVITLMQTNRMKKMPIILIDKEYWKPLEDLIYNRLLARGLVSDKEIGYITSITDDVDEAIEIINTYCKCNKK